MKNLIDCPAERAVYFLGGKWKIRILFSLLQSKKVRFGELKSYIYWFGVFNLSSYIAGISFRKK
ncbi:hypothetical protein OAS64_00490 [Candidatus Pelagibacter sp.]|nr:hypothetical protein [Candidatus Pelagibacter sp.]